MPGQGHAERDGQAGGGGDSGAGKLLRVSGRATARLTLSKKVAAKVTKPGVVAATATIRQGESATRVSFTLTAGRKAAKAKAFWTDGHLQCSQDGSGAPPAYLSQPDFTTQSPTPISTRGWIAWYTARGGWHWLGTGRWNTWTATVGGVAQFHPDLSNPNPVHGGAVSVPAGQAIFTVGVYEIVYWVGGRPDYQWQYVNAGPTGRGGRYGQPLLRLRMTRALVTGGAGFIGSNLVDGLIARGISVAVLDDLSTGNVENLAGAIQAGATVPVGDITDPLAVENAFAAVEPDVVYHLAAQIDVRRAVSDPGNDARNVLGTATVLEQSLHSGVSRFVMASTGGAIYGDASVVPTPETARTAALALRRVQGGRGGLRRVLRPRPGAQRVRPAAGQRLRPAAGPRGEAGVIAMFCSRPSTAGFRPCSATAARHATSCTSGTSSTRSARRGRAWRWLLQRRDGARENRGTRDALGLQPAAAPPRAGEAGARAWPPGWRRSCWAGTRARRSSMGSRRPSPVRRARRSSGS